MIYNLITGTSHDKYIWSIFLWEEIITLREKYLVFVTIIT